MRFAYLGKLDRGKVGPLMAQSMTKIDVCCQPVLAETLVFNS